jgi:hypothetical protein
MSGLQTLSKSYEDVSAKIVNKILDFVKHNGLQMREFKHRIVVTPAMEMIMKRKLALFGIKDDLLIANNSKAFDREWSEAFGKRDANALNV